MGRFIHIVFLVLRCSECENINCVFANKYIPYGSLEGCTRNVSDDTYAKYIYYLEERWPNELAANYSREHISRTYSEIIDFLETEVYAAPIENKLNKQGKCKIKKLDHLEIF